MTPMASEDVVEQAARAMAEAEGNACFLQSDPLDVEDQEAYREVALHLDRRGLLRAPSQPMEPAVCRACAGSGWTDD